MDDSKHTPQLKAIFKKFLSFNLVGLVNTAITYGIYALAVAIGVNHFIALGLDYAFGLIISFLLNKNLTFRIREKTDTRMFLKMIIAYVPSFLINMVLLWLFIDVFGMNKYLSQFMALALVSLFSFFMQHTFVFNYRNKDKNDGNRNQA